MRLNGLLTQAHLESDQLVRLAGDHPSQDFLLAVAQRSDHLLDPGSLAIRAADFEMRFLESNPDVAKRSQLSSMLIEGRSKQGALAPEISQQIGEAAFQKNQPSNAKLIVVQFVAR